MRAISGLERFDLIGQCPAQGSGVFDCRGLGVFVRARRRRAPEEHKRSLGVQGQLVHHLGSYPACAAGDQHYRVFVERGLLLERAVRQRCFTS